MYGLGANALSADACARIFEVKGRPRFDPLIVHVLDRGAAESLVESLGDTGRSLADAFWPGPLTLVARKRDVVPDIVTAGLPSVALRVPSHPIARALLELSGCPIAAPSANPFGYLSPTTAEHVQSQLGDSVAWVLDGGACDAGIESTIVDVTRTPPVLLRPGSLEIERIEACVGPLGRAPRSPGPVAPGQLESHYAPRGVVTLLPGRAERRRGAGRVGLLAFSEPAPEVRESFAAVEVLSGSGSLTEAATRLFACLHRLDALGLDSIWAEPVPERGVGVAVMDRLRRASARRVE